MLHADDARSMTPRNAGLLEHVRAQLLAGQPDWKTQPPDNGATPCRDSHIPVKNYFDPETWQAEIQQLFRAQPLIAAHSSELAPGQVMAHDSYGLPLLLSRDPEGVVHCFLNVCRHRGMRLVQSGKNDSNGSTGSSAQSCKAVVCPYHGWTYQLDGRLRHMLHADAFDACPNGGHDLTALPCTERHGLIWVLPDVAGQLDLDTFLGGLNDELPFYGMGQLQHFRTIEAEYPANWKLIIDAFLESYHIRVLHKDTIYPFFADGITSAERFGPHIHSLVARRAAQDWAAGQGALPASAEALAKLVTTSQVIFPNTVTIFHPDYLSLITLYPTGPETLRWTHRMLIPADKATPDWAPHWEKTFRLVEQGVFQKEDIHCAIGIQQGLKTAANDYLTVGRAEQGVAWFHEQVQQHLHPTI